MFKTKYRVGRDSYSSSRYSVYYKKWYWPFWTEWGIGLLKTKEEAYELIELLTDIKT